MLLVIIAVVLLVIGIVWVDYDEFNFVAIIFAAISTCAIIISLALICEAQLVGTKNVSLYENDIAYIQSFDGLELSPNERVTVLEKVNDVNSEIISQRVWIDNPFLNWFVSKPVAQLDLIEYDFDQSVFNVKFVE